MTAREFEGRIAGMNRPNAQAIHSHTGLVSWKQSGTRLTAERMNILCRNPCRKPLFGLLPTSRISSKNTDFKEKAKRSGKSASMGGWRFGNSSGGIAHNRLSR